MYKRRGGSPVSPAFWGNRLCVSINAPYGLSRGVEVTQPLRPERLALCDVGREQLLRCPLAAGAQLDHGILADAQIVVPPAF